MCDFIYMPRNEQATNSEARCPTISNFISIIEQSKIQLTKILPQISDKDLMN